jgi:hypothetical protein
VENVGDVKDLKGDEENYIYCMNGMVVPKIEA